MPKNFFLCREKRSMDSDKVKCNEIAFIVEKHMQGCKSIDELKLGLIRFRLSNGGVYKNGCKVKLAPISEETREKIKPLIDKYYKNTILNFEKGDKKRIEEDFLNLDRELSELGIDLIKECKEYNKELIVGRIQYFLYPDFYKPLPKKNIVKLGLINNRICNELELKKQIGYIKGKYIIKCDKYNEIIDKLIRYRTLLTTLDKETIYKMGLTENYCEIVIEDDRVIKEIKYIILN